MKNLYFFLVTILIASCASPQKSLEKGNYNKAFKAALNELRKNKSNAKTKEVLITALNEIIIQEREYLNMVMASGNIQKQVSGLKAIEKLQDKIESAERYTNDEFAEVSQNLAEDEQWLIDEISSFYADEAVDYLNIFDQTGEKLKARRAYESFRKSNKYAPLSEGLDSLMELSLEWAQVYYNIEVSTIWNVYYSNDIRRKMEDLADEGGTYLQVYFESAAPRSDFDCNIVVSFNSLEIDTRESESSQEYERTITTTETTTNADGEEVTVDVETVVKATVFTAEVVKTAAWDIDISVNGNRNCGVRGDRFSEQVLSRIENERFEGDERALPSSYGSRRDETLMSDGDLVDDLLDKVYDQVRREVF